MLGAADSVSVVVRATLVQLMTPNEMLGRVSAVNMLFVGTSNQLGEFESGTTAAWFGVVPSAVIGGIGTMCVSLLWMKLFPALRDIRWMIEELRVSYFAQTLKTAYPVSEKRIRKAMDEILG